jgi:hypothetical protein
MRLSALPRYDGGHILCIYGQESRLKEEPLSRLHVLPVLQQDPLQHVPAEGLQET